MSKWCINFVHEDGFNRFWAKSLKEARAFLYHNPNFFNDFPHIEIVRFEHNRVVSKYNCFPCSIIKVDLSLENQITLQDYFSKTMSDFLE